MKQIKEELKSLAKEIRELKAMRKTEPFGYVRRLEPTSWEFRHRHMAYCLLRGTPMERIEPHNREGNEPCQGTYETYMRQYEEAIRDRRREIEEKSASSTSGPCSSGVHEGVSEQRLGEQVTGHFEDQETEAFSTAS